jgi:rRNA maturation endonuclease Nob1
MLMTVGELKEMLEDLERMHGNRIEDFYELEVYASCDYGDHCHTQQLVEINEPRIIIPRETAYSETRMAVPTCDDEEIEQQVDAAIENEDFEKLVVVL